MRHVLFAFLLGCGVPDQGVGNAVDDGIVGDSGSTAGGAALPPAAGPQLDAQGVLNRASLDLRGRRPSLEELAAVQADPAALDDLLDQMLLDDAVPERMAWLWNERMHTALWASSYDRFIGELQRDFTFDEWRALGWEPLALVAALVDEDRPFTDLVTAAQIPTHARLAELYGTVGAPAEGWDWGHYDDPRPMSGMLSSTTFWLRYNDNLVNHNRRRANAVADILLCSDFFDREGTASFQIEGEFSDIENAVETEAACTSCHAALDPLASFFGGFVEQSANLPMAQFFSYSEFNDRWTRARLAPAYFGAPGQSIRDLGVLMAADPRFSSCVVQTFWEGLTDQPWQVDQDSAALVADFVAQGAVVRPLLAEILDAPAYRSATLRVLRTEQLAAALEDLSGWRPGDQPDDGLSPLTWSVDHRILGGNTDDISVLYRNRSQNLATQLLQTWTGRQAAVDMVATDLGRDLDDRRLVTVDEAAGEAQVREALAGLAGRALGRLHDPDGEEVDLLFELWLDGGGWDAWADAWSLVVEALIRHPDMGVY